MEHKTIHYTVADHVAVITLNRPEAMNAIDKTMRDNIHDAIGTCSADPEVRTIVIAANGRGFSAGTDLEEAAGKPDTYRMLEEEYKPIFNLILQCPKPVIAAVNGVCAGVGASLALACDLIVMGESACMLLAFANVGLIPDGGMCWHLLRSLGYRHAYQVIAEGGRIDSQHCLSAGLVNKVVDDEKLLEETRQWAERLTHAAPLSLKFAKQVLQQSARMDLLDTMRLEASLQAICANSEDGAEGVMAFLEKRKPVFQGK